MTAPLNGPVTPPLYDLLTAVKTATLRDIRCCLPGKVTAVDTVKSTVDVQVTLMQYDQKGVAFSYPPLTGCHAVTVQGGGVGVKVPVAVGDECLVFFSDRCVDAWFKTGSPQPLPNPRMHDLSDGFALIGVNSLANALLTSMLSGEGGICETRNATGAKVAIDPITHKITIVNQAHNLFTILSNLNTTLNNLITVLNSLTTVGGPTTQAISPATVAALVPITTQLTAIQTDIAGLLY